MRLFRRSPLRRLTAACAALVFLLVFGVGTAWHTAAGPASCPGQVARRVVQNDSLGASTALYDGSRPLADTRAEYTLGGATGLISERSSLGSRWYHGDATDGTRGLTDPAQAVTDSLQYDAFGAPVSTTGTSVTPYRHKGGQGYRTDPDSGLLLLGRRYYDRSLGRFISRDPLGYSAGDVNLYRYAGNNPVNGSDPSGLLSETGAVNLVVGALAGLAVGLALGVAAPAVFFSVVLSTAFYVATGVYAETGSTQQAASEAAEAAGLVFLAGIVATMAAQQMQAWRLLRAMGQCFPAGTPIFTPRGTRPIEAIRAGDLVLSADPATGSRSYQPVRRTFKREAAALVGVLTEDGRTIATTPEHPFWVNGSGFVSAKELSSGDRLQDARGRLVPVVNTTAQKARATVYNFEVANTHTYFAGSAGWWVHNDSGPYGDLTPEELERIRDLATRAGRPVYVVGSAARGERTERSDIDYVISSSSWDYWRNYRDRLPSIDSHGPIFGVPNPYIGPFIEIPPNR